jgi:myo-inositol 2-dehydrogenase / D-chiro-inositol 1-dehydrogenase
VVPADRQFVGWDAYEKVIASDVNYIILATPPAFRPMHLKAAIDAGKNVFTEKPVAVDSAGIKQVYELADLAKSKGLGVVAGTQRRHHAAYLETLKRVKDGAIGDVVALRVFWNQGGLWTKPRQAEWTDMEWQLRNWLYFSWLSGDHICEQHVHNLDVVNWAIGAHPVRAVGMGGRQVRTGPEYGNIYDHFAVDYEYPNGVHSLSMCRQIDGCENNVSEAVVGTKGRWQGSSQNASHRIEAASRWRYRAQGRDVDPYLQEHIDLIASIREGKPLNELRTVAESTLTAIMGRMSTYTGKAVTWDEALQSKLNLMPEKLELGELKVAPIPVPGQTELI